MSSSNDELTMDTAVIRPYRSRTAYTFCEETEEGDEWQHGAKQLCTVHLSVCWNHFSIYFMLVVLLFDPMFTYFCIL